MVSLSVCLDPHGAIRNSLKYVWVHRQFLACQKVLNVVAAEETFREFCLSVKKKNLQLSIGVRDFIACRFLLSRHSSIGELQQCEKLHVDCQHCLCQLSRQTVVYAKKSVYCRGSVRHLFPGHVFFFLPNSFRRGGVFKFLKVSEFVTVCCFSELLHVLMVRKRETYLCCL